MKKNYIYLSLFFAIFLCKNEYLQHTRFSFLISQPILFYSILFYPYKHKIFYLTLLYSYETYILNSLIFLQIRRNLCWIFSVGQYKQILRQICKLRYWKNMPLKCEIINSVTNYTTFQQEKNYQSHTNLYFKSGRFVSIHEMYIR